MSKPEPDWLHYPTGAIPKSAFCPHCKRYNTRHSTVETVVIKGGQVLLINRKLPPQNDWWAMPGGYVDWDETVEEAGMRELKEETNLEPGTVKLLAVYSDTNRDKDGRQNIGHAYVITNPKGSIKIDPEEVNGYQWFDLDALPDKIAFDHRQIIEDYKKTIQ